MEGKFLVAMGGPRQVTLMGSWIGANFRGARHGIRFGN